MSSTASYMQAHTNIEPDPRFQNVPQVGELGGFAEDTNYGTTKTAPATSQAKKFRLRISKRLHYTAILAFVSFLLLVTAFASPYWLSSYKFTGSHFVRLGLWEFCFQNYRHPSYQYDTKFTGCHWVYSNVYTNIRDWLQPPWFMFVQAVTTIALCTDALGLVAISILFMHYLIQYQLIILSVALVCHLFTTTLLSFSVITFYLKAFDRSWIMYPNFNHTDWAFSFAFLSTIANGTTVYLYYKEIQLLKERMLKMRHLVVATTSGQSQAGDDMDSLDAVYATRSTTSYHNNQQQTNNDNPSRNRPASAFKNQSALIYPHFTQV